MADLLEVLDVIVADDPDSRGDFWRAQPWVAIPRVVRGAPGRRTRRSPRAAAAAARRQAVRHPARCTSTPIRMPAPADRASAARPVSASRPAPSVLDAVGRRRAPTSRPPAPRSSTSTSRSCRNYEGDRAGAPTIADPRPRAAGVPATRDRRPVGVGVGRLPRRERRPGALRRSPRSTARRSSRTPTGALPDRYDRLRRRHRRSTRPRAARTRMTDPLDRRSRRSAAGLRGLERRAASTSRSGWMPSASTPSCSPRAEQRGRDCGGWRA